MELNKRVMKGRPSTKTGSKGSKWSPAVAKKVLDNIEKHKGPQSRFIYDPTNIKTSITRSPQAWEDLRLHLVTEFDIDLKDYKEVKQFVVDLYRRHKKQHLAEGFRALLEIGQNALDARYLRHIYENVAGFSAKSSLAEQSIAERETSEELDTSSSISEKAATSR